MTQRRNERNVIHLDQVLNEEVGTYGWFQLKVMALCALVALLSGLRVNLYIFTFAQVNTRCFIPECESDPSGSAFTPPWILDAVPAAKNSFDSCHRYATFSNISQVSCSANAFNRNITMECEEYVYEHKNSAVYEFNLACDDWRPNLVGSVSSFGTMLALPIGGFVADQWGRRVALALSAFNLAWIGLLLYFANTYICYLLTVFACRLLGASCIDNAFILAVEYVGTKHRVAVTSALNSFIVIGRVLTGAIISTDIYWRNLILVVHIPLLITFLYFWFAPESIRWLMSKGRYEEAIVILKRAAQINGNILSKETMHNLRNTKINVTEKNKSEPWLIFKVFKHKPILLRCLLTPIWWLTTIFIFCGLTLSSVNLSSNRFANYSLVSAVAIPGYCIALLLLDRIGRKPLLMMAFWICGTCLFVYIVIPKNNFWLSLSMYLFSKLCTTVAMTTISVYTVELYPTRHRASLYAFSSTIGSLGSVLAPVILSLAAVTWHHLPYAVYGTMAFFSGFLVFLTPETLGSTLPDTMEEAANLGKGQNKTVATSSNVLDPLMTSNTI